MNENEAEALAEKIQRDIEAHVTVLSILPVVTDINRFYIICCYENGMPFVVKNHQMWLDRRSLYGWQEYEHNLAGKRVDFKEM